MAGVAVGARSPRADNPVERAILRRYPTCRTIAAVERELRLPEKEIRKRLGGRLRAGHTPTAATINELARLVDVPAMVLGMHFLVAAGVERAGPDSTPMNQLMRHAGDLPEHVQRALVELLRAIGEG